MNVDRIPSASKGPQGDRRAPSSHRDTLRVCPSHLAQHTQRGFWAPCRCRPDAGRPSPSQRSRQEIRAKTSSTLNRRRQRVQTSALDRGHSRGRVSPKPRDAEVILTGRGMAYAYRSQTVVAEIAEVEVNRETGHVWVKRLVCAHDCGLVIDPEGPKDCAARSRVMLHSLSRVLHEEVRFDTERVTSVDWRSHPSLMRTRRPRSTWSWSTEIPIRTGPIHRTTEPAKRYANRWLRPSPTPYTTRLEFVFAGFRSETSACSRSSKPQACRQVRKRSRFRRRSERRS